MAKIDRLLNSLELAQQQLKLELMKSMLLQPIEDALVALRQLPALGLHISNDDFGSGYAFLTYPKGMPISELTMDRSLVRGIPCH